MKNKLRQIQALVHQILLDDEASRASDIRLWLQIINKVDQNALTITLGDFLNNFNYTGVPKYESVTRARRKVQELHPELKPSEEVLDERYENFKAYKETFAK